ncbi:MAG: peptide ABC transporter substrate-binding protein [Chloroflexota bacterium]
MRKLRWQLLIVLVSLVAIAVLLVGQQRVVLPGVEPVDAPVSGGVYSEALIGTLGRLNPVLDYYSPADHDVDRLIFSGLVRFDDRGLPHGDLADSWGISQDGTVYNFLIRSQAVWHDGEPVTSEDVIFTVELLRDEAIPLPVDLHNFWNQVEVKALDDSTLQFILPEPFAPFLDYLTFGVLPEHLLGGYTADEIIQAEYNIKPVGSGPYRFQGLEAENGNIKGVVLSAFQEYYGRPAYIDQFVFRYYPDAQAAMSAYEAGEVMGISQITQDVLQKALRTPELNLFTGRLPRLTLIFLNLDSPDLPFFQDIAVRRALLEGINRRWIIDRILGGQAILAHAPIFPDNWAYYEGGARVEYDPQQAVAALKKAGYTIPAEGGNVREKDGVSLSFELVYPDSEPYTKIAEWVQGEWERLGVEAKLKAVPYEELMQDYLEPRSYQAALVELNLAHSPDPDPYPFWHQAQANTGQNYSQWDDRQVSEYLEQARVNVDVADRTKLYRNFQVRFGNDVPALLLYYPVYTYALDAQVKGVSMGPLYDPSDRFMNVTDWYLLIGRAEPKAETATPVP